jgi:serine phosphatase RsbU (regulator of sigma subunit)
MFATVFFAVLDPATGSLVYVNAGHEPPQVFGPDRVRRELPPTGPALGLFPDSVFGIACETMGPGECLLAYTDGVTDAKGAEGFFSKDRLLALLAKPVPSAADLVETIAEAVSRHTGDRELFDDVTLLAAFWKPAS